MGQIHLVTQPIEPFSSRSGAIEVHALPAERDNLVWLLIDRGRQEAVVVDGPDAAAAIACCDRLGVRLLSVWNTHTHPDHIGINRDLQARGLLQGLVVISSREANLVVPGTTRAVGEGDEVEFAGQSALVLATPGHQDGHISFVVDGILLCGDTLFAGGCGYLFDGPPSLMHASLSKLAALPSDTLVLCAHEYTLDNLRFAWSVEPENQELRERVIRTRELRARGACTLPSQLGLELATNPFLRTNQPGLRRGLARALGQDPGAQDQASDAEVFALLRKHKDQGAYKSIADAELPARS